MIGSDKRMRPRTQALSKARRGVEPGNNTALMIAAPLESGFADVTRALGWNPEILAPAEVPGSPG